MLRAGDANWAICASFVPALPGTKLGVTVAIGTGI